MSGIATEPAQCLICGASEGTAEARGRDYIYRGSQDEMTAWRCAACGHVYLNPRPRPESIGAMYPETAQGGVEQVADGLLGRLRERVMLGRVAPLLRSLGPGSTVLDIGCGDGQLLLAIRRRRPDLAVHGLDWRFAPALRARLERAGVVLHAARLEEAALPPGRFGLVTMHQLIEHLWEPRAGLARVRAALAPGGRLVITTPDLDGYDRRLFRSGRWGGYYFPRHLNLFTRASLARLLHECGYRVETSAGLVAPVVWCHSLKAAASMRFPRAGWLGRVFDPANAPLLALFALLDAVALGVGLRTSNQLALAVADAVPPPDPAPPAL